MLVSLVALVSLAALAALAALLALLSLVAVVAVVVVAVVVAVAVGETLLTAVEDRRGSKRSLTRPAEVLLVCHRKVVSTGRARRCNRYSCLNQSSRVVTGDRETG
jgi:hypothetical protein